MKNNLQSGSCHSFAMQSFFFHVCALFVCALLFCMPANAQCTWYYDGDSDGFGNPAVMQDDPGCAGPAQNYVADNSDCDDTQLTYDDIDGDGWAGGPTLVPCGLPFFDCDETQWTYADLDGDGFGNGTTPPTPCGVANNLDCDDTQFLYPDNDGDGFGGGSIPVPCGLPLFDCDDTQITYDDTDGDGWYGGPPVPCGGSTDNSDCDPTHVTYFDRDGDGWGGDSAVACGGIAENNLDCDDRDANLYPVAQYIDNDLDGHGTDAIAIGFAPCNNLILPPGVSYLDDDCNDANGDLYPGAPELCDGLDNDCDDLIDEDAVCADDGNVCTEETCEPSTGCITTPKCDDENTCTRDFCNETTGNCTHDGFVFPLADGCCTADYDCNDGDVCTEDNCDVGFHCSNRTIDYCCRNEAECDDSDICTQDLCNPGAGGGCSHIQRATAGTNCCVEHSDCHDSDVCTEDVCGGDFRCSNRAIDYCCRNEAECNDNDICTQDLCNPGAGGGCSHIQRATAGTNCCVEHSDCHDSDVCTEDVCGGLFLCVNTPIDYCCRNEVECDDNDICTQDLCNPGPGGGCSHIQRATAGTNCCVEHSDCHDSDVCTEDVCGGDFRCSNRAIDYCCKVDDDCAEAAACVMVTCNTTTNSCVYTDFCISDACCDDSDACTDNICTAGACSYPAKNCCDGIACTIDNCDAGVCTHDSSNCPLDCIVSEWGAWGSCSVTCGGGVECRTRTVITRNANGGAECPLLEECRPCNSQSCDPCFGLPSLTVRGLTLVYEHTVGEVGPLTTGQVIDKDTLCRFNIRADVCPSIIGSVKFQLSGTQTLTKVETVAPYAGFGDSPPGDYNPWSPPVGSYTLKVTGYSGPNATGTAGTPLIVQFSVIDATPGTATNCARPQINCAALNCDDGNACTSDDCNPGSGCVYTTINCNDDNACTTDQCVSGICQYTSISCNDNNGCTIDICNTSGGCQYTAVNCNDFNACTTDQCPPSTGLCVNNLITCNDNNSCTTDNCNPSTGCTYTPGTNCCTINTDCDDNILCTVDACSSGLCNNTVVGQRVVTSFTLVNSANEADIGPIDNGSVVNLAVTPNINIRANLCTNTGTESIRFKLNANNNFRTESDIPYALAGDAPPGDYHKWNVTPGVYTITATPYAGNNATGAVGTSKTITITVVNGAPKMSEDENIVSTMEDRGVMLSAYPNPFSARLNIEFSLLEDSRVKLELFSVTGQRLANLFEGDARFGELNRVEYNPAMSSDCMVIYRLQTVRGTYYGKAVMVK